MFSGFDNIAEGFKRFSLDALQREEETNENEAPKRTEHVIPDIPMQPRVPETTPGRLTEAAPAITRSGEEDDEWDWQPGDVGQVGKPSTRARKLAAQRGNEAPLESSPTEPPTTSVAMSRHGNAAAFVAEAHASPGLSTSGANYPGEVRVHNISWTERNVAHCNVKVLDLVDDERGAKDAEQLRPCESIAARTSEHPDSVSVQKSKEQELCTTTTLTEGSGVVKDATQTKNETFISGSARTNLSEETAAVKENGGGLAIEGGDAVVMGSDGGALAFAEAVKTYGNGSSETPVSGYSDERKGFEMQGDEGASFANKVSTDEGHEAGQATQVMATADAEASRAAQRELSQANSTLLALQGALRDSQHEVARLRDMVSTQENKTRRQEEKIACLSDDVNAAQMGFQESNEAHQRTAQRTLAFENELENTRRTIDALRSEKTALKEQVDAALEDRKVLEAQLRQLQAGLNEAQEAARQEARKEVERLEARLKEVMKDRERKTAELELQNARRKETREMARDLESQLAAVDRISQEREAEAIKLREEIAGLRKNSGEATEEKNTWATKYEALERNFKQVRAQGKKAEAELDEVRNTVRRIEAEKAALVERVEDEAVERVTVVASITHERNFLLRQVDRLEQEVAGLRRVEEARATAAAARAQTTGELEEYRSRAQQALKRANEVTSQTVAENKRLEVAMAKLSAEVARQRPVWEQAKRQEKLHLAKLAELKEQLTMAATDRENTATDMASLQERLARQEEERSATLASVVRLEAQGESLKQELQRQQKALAAFQEREAILEKRLAENAPFVPGTEDRQHQQPMRAEGNADQLKFPASPLPAGQSPSLGWDSEKLTPRNGTNPEMPGAAWTSRLRSHGSTHSFLSDGESSDAPTGSAAEQLFYVHQLRERMSREQIEMRSLISELEASRAKADAQAAKQAQLEKRLEAALLDKKRLQELDQGRNASINLEYLKNCVVGCLRTSEPSEHARLLPVITTILKLSREEAEIIAKNITARAQHQGSFGGSLPPTPSKTSASTRPEAGPASKASWWSTK